MGLLRFLAILFLLACINSVAGQEYSHARYDVKDGLAGSVVYHGVEDKDGFLWFATETGVSRFDGTHFQNFTMAEGLPDNEIIRMYVDSKNRVWMIPFRSTICYYWKGKIFTQENDPLLRQLPVNGSIQFILEDKTGTLILGDNTQLYFINTDEQVRIINKIDGINFHVVQGGVNETGNTLVIANIADVDSYLVEFDAKGNKISKKLYPYRPLSLHSNYLSARLHISASQDSLLFWNAPSAAYKSIKRPASFNSISVLSDTLCAINTAYGALFFNTKQGKVIRHVLKGKNVNAVLQDSEGNTWLFTAGMGIVRISSFEFQNLIFQDDQKNDLPVYCLTRIDSLIYAGSEQSWVYIIHPQRLTIASHQVNNPTFNNKVAAIVEFPVGRIVLGGNGVIDMKRPHIKLTNHFSVKSLFVHKDSLLASTNTGVLLLSKDFKIKDLMWKFRSTCSYILDDVLYCGSLNGLYRIDGIDKFSWLGNQDDLLKSRIADMTGTADGILWIATQGAGLVGYKNGKVWCTFRQKDGLSSDNCRKIYITGNDIWIGTDKGVNRIQQSQEGYRVTSFTSTDGLLSDIVNAIYVDSAQVYVGTSAGITTFNVDKISLNSYCRLRMTRVQYNDATWPVDTTDFTLPPDNNAIQFNFVGISYRSAGDITYRYRIAGLNDKWQTTRENTLNYPTLPSGNYELQLVATNKFGVESEMIRIPFRVEKHLWGKNWFRVLALLIGAFVIWLLINVRIKKISRQNDEKMQINNRMAELEQMALKAQMNPHFIFNSLNSVQQYVIDKDLRGANKFITEFSRLIRLTLDISSRNKISMYEEIDYLTTYLELEKTKFEGQFSYSVVLAPALDPSEWFIPPMILQPYVENSIRHGVRYRKDRLGHIKLSFNVNGQYLICQVEDNGVGRKKAAQYKSEMPIEYQSKGMTLTAKRIEMLNKNQADPVLITIEDLEVEHIAAGTRVIVRFPLQDASNSL